MSITPLPDANFTPTFGGYSNLKNFKFWCQTVLPLVYDDSLSYYELLNKVVDYLNNVISDLSTTTKNTQSLLDAYNLLQNYVNTYFNSLDVQAEINNKLDLLARNGTLTNLLSPIIPNYVTEWLAENITPTTPIVDNTLSIKTAAADSYYTGLHINAVKLHDMLKQNNVEYDDIFTLNGSLFYSTGNDYDTENVLINYSKTPFIYINKGDILCIYGLNAITSICRVAFYDLNFNYIQEYSLAGLGANAYSQSPYYEAQNSGYVRLSTIKTALENTDIKITTKNYNILSLGNSFCQDIHAYLPMIFKILAPDYDITVANGYISSASPLTHINAYNNNSVYTWYNLYPSHNHSWTRYAKGGSNEKTFNYIINNYKWDIIYVQNRGNITQQEELNKKFNYSSQFISILQNILNYDFKTVTGQWTVENQSLPYMYNALKIIKASGFNYIIPVAQAIANARTNAYLKNLGDSGNMLFDGTHIQNGIPNLLCSLTLAIGYLDILGIKPKYYNDIYIPTNENNIANNAYKSQGDVTPLPMTHGRSVGVLTDQNEINYKLLKTVIKIANIAYENPETLVNCRDFETI